MLFSVSNLDALRNNAQIIKQKNNTKVIAVLKHNAYSCGSVACAKALFGKVHCFAVSSLSEAKSLIDSGSSCNDIMVLDPFIPTELNQDLLKVILPIDSLEIMRALSNIYINRPLRVQLRFDLCGSGIGLSENLIDEAISLIKHSEHLTLYGIFAHAPSLYRCEEVRNISMRFSALCQKTKQLFPQALCHIATSASLNYELLRFDACRVGTALFGLPSRDGQDIGGLLPVLSLHTSLLRVFKSSKTLSFYDKCVNTAAIKLAGIVSTGYGALPALLYKKELFVLVRNTLVPIIGSVSMGHFVVDLTEVPESQIGDEVIIVGKTQKREITAESFAKSCGVSSCKCDGALFTTETVARIYIDNSNCIVKL